MKPLTSSQEDCIRSNQLPSLVKTDLKKKAQTLSATTHIRMHSSDYDFVNIKNTHAFFWHVGRVDLADGLQPFRDMHATAI